MLQSFRTALEKWRQRFWQLRLTQQSSKPACQTNPATELSLSVLLDERAIARHWLLSQGEQSWATLSGLGRSGLRGRGLDFSEMRHYQAGDDIRSIDWLASARSGKTQIRLYREERERPVYIIINFAASMRFASRKQFKSILAARLAALIAWASEAHGDRVGGLVYHDDGLLYIPPLGGKRGATRLLQQLVNAHRQAETTDNKHSPPWSTLLQKLQQKAPSGSVLCFISDFQEIDHQSEAMLAQLRRRFDVIGIHIFDPLEQQLPNVGPLWFYEQGEHLRLERQDEQRRQQHQHRFMHHRQSVTRLFTQNRSFLLRLSTEHDLHASLQRLLKLKSKHQP